MIEDRLIFTGWNDQWYLFVLLIFITGGLVILDLYKNKRRLKGLRMLSYSLVFISVGGLILKPSYRTTKEAEKVIVLTDGYSQIVLDSLLKQDASLKVYAKLSEKSFSDDYQQIWDIYDLKYLNENIDHIELLGEGLTLIELENLSGVDVGYYPADSPKGIIDLQYQRSIEVDKTVAIQGKSNSSSGTKFIIFNGETVLDSTITNKHGEFTLSVTPNAIGRFDYNVEEYIGDSLLRNYPLPLEVVSQRQLRVLFINDFPVFDTKYLRNHLVKHGHEVSIRNRYSKNKFNYEYYNTNDKSAINLVSERMKNVDLLILDQRSLLELSAQELLNIGNLVKDYGLTVLLQNAQEFTKMNSIELFEGLSIDENGGAEFVVQQGVSISNNPYSVAQSALPIISSQSVSVLGGYKYVGIGKVGILSFQNSYELILKGHQQIYEDIWSDIMNQLSKRDIKQVTMDFEEEYPLVNTQLRVILENNTSQKYQVSINGLPLSMKQDIQLLTFWTSEYWVNNSGWVRMSVEDTDFENYRYVFDEVDWGSLISYRRIIDNAIFARSPRKPLTQTIKYDHREVSPMILYILFLISIAYLWIESKI